MGRNDSRLAFRRESSLLPDDGAQIRQELRLIYGMLAAGIRNRMEASDRTPHAMHPVVQEDPDRHGPAPHDIVNELGCFNGHHDLQAAGFAGHHRSTGFSITVLCAASMRRRTRAFGQSFV
jgi:hypothetical protein